MIRDAIVARDGFNVIDERSVLKIDVFVPASGPLGEGQLARRDVVSVVRLRRELDLAYLKDTAALVGLSPLLDRALSDGRR